MRFIFLIFLGLLLFGFQQSDYIIDESRILKHVVNPIEQNLHFYLMDDSTRNYLNFENLKNQIINDSLTLTFAMNGGMYLKDYSPQGLYIEDGQLITKMDTVKEAFGNFYMQPNGIFYLTKNGNGVVCKTTDFKLDSTTNYATQSGPMLLIDGQYHPRFNKGSHNLHIRNGVGVLPNGNLLFAISKELINFYDFATYFKQNGCQNALYLDGGISRIYLPSEEIIPQSRSFGVIIGEVKGRK